MPQSAGSAPSPIKGLAARAAAGDHQNCAVKFNLAERPISLEEAGRRYGSPYGALATFEVPAVDTPLEALDASRGYLDLRPLEVRRALPPRVLGGVRAPVRGLRRLRMLVAEVPL
jgi:hypothetical protein